MNLHVSIAGNDVTDLALFEGSKIQKDSTDAISTATIVFRVDFDHEARYDGAATYDSPTYVYGFNPVEWQEVVLTDDLAVRQFAGYITRIERQNVSGNITDFVCTCSDYGILLDRQTINETYSSQSDESMILDAFTGVTGITVDAGDIATIVSNMATFEAKDITLREFMERICELTGGEWRVNYDGELLYYASGSIAAPFGLSDSPDGVTTFAHGITGFTKDFSAAANFITVLGGVEGTSEITATAQSLSSQAYYTILSATVVDRSITDQETADLRAAAEIAQRAFPILNGRLETYKDGLDVGQTISITNAAYGIDQDFIIRSINVEFIRGGDALDSSDGSECRCKYDIEFGQKIPDLVSALRRLERRTRPSTNPPVAIPAPLSVVPGSFAGTIAPVNLVNAKPVGAEWDNYAADAVFLLTTDRRLYRRNGNDWTREILAADMTDQVQAGQLAADSVIAGTIAAGAIRAVDAAFDAGAIGTADIGNAQITGAKIANATITDANIVNATITGAKIASATITDANIANLSASKLTAGTIDASTITVINLNASNITTGTLSATRITAGTLTLGGTTIDVNSSGFTITTGSNVTGVSGLGMNTGIVNAAVSMTVGGAANVVGSINTTGAYYRNGTAGATGSIPNTFTSITVSGGIITGWS